MTDPKPLQPLTYGSVLIVGCKASNFSDELKRNPRVAMWESHDKKWESKELPVNTRAVFCTKWVGHNEFIHVMKEARKKNIVIFTPQGTGLIAKQVKELLNMNPAIDSDAHVKTVKYTAPAAPKVEPKNDEEHWTNHQPVVKEKTLHKGKLKVLAQFVDLKLTDSANGAALMVHANDLGIITTLKSLTIFASREKRKMRGLPVDVKHKRTSVETTAKTFPKYQNDVAVEIFDNILKELKDLREYLVSTTEENRTLRTRIEKFKNMLETE